MLRYEVKGKDVFFYYSNTLICTGTTDKFNGIEVIIWIRKNLGPIGLAEAKAIYDEMETRLGKVPRTYELRTIEELEAERAKNLVGLGTPLTPQDVVERLGQPMTAQDIAELIGEEDVCKCGHLGKFHMTEENDACVLCECSKYEHDEFPTETVN